MWSCHKHNASQMYRFGEILLWCLLIVRSMTVHADPSSCVDRFEVHRDKIIRTEDSKKLGAKFIDSMSQRNRFECLELCCRTSRCDVFVFEEKSPGTCYLFECGSPDDFKCKFTDHTNYSSAVMSFKPAAELENQIKLTQNEHEQELTKLKKFTPLTTPPSTVIPIPAINKETEITVPIEKHSERKRCSRYQFECKTSGECIAIYNACDGIPQCSDGSDEALELACPTTSSKQILPMSKDTNYGLQGNNYLHTFPNKPIDVNGQQVNQQMQQWKNQQPVFNSNTNYNNAKGDKPTYGGNYISSQYGREGEGLKWTNQDIAHQNYGNNQIFTHVNGGILQDYNRQQNNLLQNNIPNIGYNVESGIPIDHNYNHMNNINHNLKTGSKNIYQNQNNPDYFYEDPRLKVEQSNGIPQAQLNQNYQRPIQLEIKKSETLITEKPRIQKNNINETSTPSTTTDFHSNRKLEQPLIADSIIHEVYFESSDDGYAIMPNGAFISLVLGVIATSIMVVVVSCRLRVMRNRYRKGGKQSYAHDADFLINGMYL